MMIFDCFMENPYWKSVYENAPSNECREYYRIMFEYFSFETDEEDEEGEDEEGEELEDEEDEDEIPEIPEIPEEYKN